MRIQQAGCALQPHSSKDQAGNWGLYWMKPEIISFPVNGHLLPVGRRELTLCEVLSFLGQNGQKWHMGSRHSSGRLEGCLGRLGLATC